jgi:hypothetical protein
MIQKHYNRKTVERYKELRRQEKKIHNIKKKLFHEGIIKETEQHNSRSEIGSSCKLIHNIRSKFKSKSKLL